MERLVNRRMFVRRLLLPLFLLISSGHFIASSHAFVWGKNDPEGRVKNAKVSYNSSLIASNANIFYYFIFIDFRVEIPDRIRFYCCGSWIGRSGDCFAIVRDRRLDCAVTRSRRWWNNLVGCTRCGQISTADWNGLAISNRAATGTVFGFEGAQVWHSTFCHEENSRVLVNHCRLRDGPIDCQLSLFLWLTCF